MAVLGGVRFLMSEVPLYLDSLRGYLAHKKHGGSIRLEAGRSRGGGGCPLESVLRRAHLPRGGPICPEADLQGYLAQTKT